MPKSDHCIALESFDGLTSYWRNPKCLLKWNCIFVLPPWLEAWWQGFGSLAELYLCAVSQEDAIIGVAPLLSEKGGAFFAGSADVCDYLDFVIAPARESDFFTILLEDLKRKGVNYLSLGPVRPDSTVITHLVGLAEHRGHAVSCKAEDVSLELDLPPTWDEYLSTLSGKQRHEVRRKLRRLHEKGEVTYRTIKEGDAVADAVDVFLGLFRKSRRDKEIFLTAARESFFRSLTKAMAHAQLLTIGILELDAQPVAATLCFDYNDTVYLYNSGYDPEYSFVSAGLVSKILCIKDSIESGKKKFDFLKGAEEYKHRLGGKEIHLRSCRIEL